MSKDAAPEKPSSKPGEDRVVPAQYLYPFILVTTLFAFWGFANDITNPLVRAFKEIFLISNAQSSLVQWAFYGGYATMAIPAALVIRFVSFKSGIIIGLLLYASGCAADDPRQHVHGVQHFPGWVLYSHLRFGLSGNDCQSVHPLDGTQTTATRRLNLAQAFNPVGSLTGMFVASVLILPSLDVAEFREAEKERHPEYAKMLPSEVDGLITESLEDYAKERLRHTRRWCATI